MTNEQREIYVMLLLAHREREALAYRDRCEKEGDTILFDPQNKAGMKVLMDQFGESQTLFTGVNQNGEQTHTSIFPDRIVVVTFQENGWVRKNTYWQDGSQDEMFEGKGSADGC